MAYFRVKLVCRFVVVAAIAATLSAADVPTASEARAQPVPSADIESKREALFERVIANPTDLDTAFEYALLSIEAGDSDAAISTLERMLIFAPGQPRVQLELGALYFNVGSYQLARSYLQGVIENGNAPPEVVQRVQLYLAEIDKRADPPPFYGYISTGPRWQSNANSAADSRTVSLNGLPFLLDERATGQPDWSWLTIGNVHGIYDPKDGSGDVIEADLLLYSARYLEQRQVDLELAELTLGPTINLKRFRMPASKLGLYGIGNVVRLADAPYFTTIGAGARLVSHAIERTSVDLKSEYRYRSYSNSADFPTLSTRDGPQYKVFGTLRYLLMSDIVLSGQAYFQREDTEADFLDNDEVGGNISATITLPDHGLNKVGPWALHMSVGAARRDYDTPDPVINVDVSEVDRIYWGRASLTVPVTKSIAVVPQVEYRDQQSNYDVRDFDNLTVHVGTNWRF